jgi:pullulanase/glycogen debranching enzyme
LADLDIQDKGHALIAFVQKLIGLRRNLFLNGQYLEDLGVKDVTWINANGKEMEDKNWGDSACAALACCCMDAPRAPAFGSGEKKPLCCW